MVQPRTTCRDCIGQSLEAGDAKNIPRTRSAGGADGKRARRSARDQVAETVGLGCVHGPDFENTEQPFGQAPGFTISWEERAADVKRWIAKVV